MKKLFGTSLKRDFLDCDQEAIKVEATRIGDSVIAKKLTRVDLIKMDVERVEEIALRGMRQTVQMFKRTLFIEVLDNRPDLDTAKGEDRNFLFTMDL